MFRGIAARVLVLCGLLFLFLSPAARLAYAATFTVNSNGDAPDANPGNGVCETAPANGVCTLRAAIQEANASAGADLISFSIGAGPQTISPTSPLPLVTDSVTIDGTTQPGFVGTPIIELNGAAAGPGADGLAISAGNSTVRGLVINRFSRYGIALQTNGGNLVQGNYIGTDLSGTLALSNVTGVYIASGANNTIGGTTAAARNVLSGNLDFGVFIDAGSVSNLVQGNYIGTNASGTAAVGNLLGVFVLNAPSNTIGGTTAGARNLISGNRGGAPSGNTISGHNVGSSSGAFIQGAGATGNLVQGNFVGTDVSGTLAVPNGGTAVVGNGGSAGPPNTIGGTAPGARNIISGNASGAITLGAGHLVQGNYIGTDVTGTIGLGNGGHGIDVFGANNVIGGTVSGARNIISANNGGMSIVGAGNLVQGNYIGTDVTGTIDLGNQNNGIGVSSGATNNTIGGTTPAARNVISGNSTAGVALESPGTTANLVQGNFIGTDATGTQALPNDVWGVLVAQGASGNTIGGTTSGAGNVISGNRQFGVQISDTGTTANVQGNLIGTDATGTAALGNGTYGVLISASNNTVGGTAPGAANTIAFSVSPAGAGVFVQSGTGNGIRRNAIFSNGGLGIDLFPTGVTPNDPMDPDTGANNLQNFPVLTSVTTSGGSVTITGMLNSTPNTTFTLEFFSNTVCDPSGFGEGELFLGSTTVTTNASGDASFTATFPTSSPAAFITATATDPGNNTSEFSQCKQSTPMPQVSTPGKVTGGGSISPTGEILEPAILIIQSGTNAGVGGKATFGFVIKFATGDAAPTGNLTYHDHGANVTIKATSYDLLVITGTHAEFTGTAEVNGVPGKKFKVAVDDLSEPGAGHDTFSITLLDASYAAAGVLTGGNIQIH